MKLPSGLVGVGIGPRVEEIDARWLMAYAAALGETDEAYLDTRRPGGILAHPLFPVCYEWPLAVEMRAALPEEVALRSVHASHDLRLHRLPRPGDRLSVRATVTRVEPRRSGAAVLSRYEALDAGGEPVSTTDYGSIYLGVACEPEGVAPPASGSAGPEGAGAQWSADVAVAPTLAHVYTECARIWNPIHTDRAVAARAGLPGIILHGTATLALAVSRVLAQEGRAADAVRRVSGRFAAMVSMPSTLTVQGRALPREHAQAFQALVGGRPAVRDGMIWFGGHS